ncbi:MAG TPA: hypothetical protein VF469_41435 [Kofleriaceae bacterium]
MQALSVVVASLGAGAALVASPARADPGGDPDDVIARPLVLPPDAVELRLTAEINLQPNELAHPIALAPDAWWGISPRWMIGVIHSDPSLDQIAVSASFCVRESDISPCNRRYRGSGIDVRYDALSGDLAIAPRARLVIRDIDPIKPAVTLGALARWVHGRFAITTDPYLRIPLANHALGNRTAIVLPVWFAVQPAEGWAIALHTGYDADLVILRDGGHGPVALDVAARITPQIDLGIEAGWGALFGPVHESKQGTLMLAAGWRG